MNEKYDLSLLRQDLRIARRLSDLAHTHTGYSAVCLLNAGIRTLSNLAEKLAASLDQDGSDQETLAWLSELSMLGRSLDEHAPSADTEVKSPDLSLIATSATSTSKLHWARLDCDYLDDVCQKLELQLQLLEQQADEY